MKSSRWERCLYLAAVLGCSRRNSGFSGVAGGGSSGAINFEVSCSSKPLICIHREGDWNPNDTRTGGSSSSDSNRCPKGAVTVQNLVTTSKLGGPVTPRSFPRWIGQITLASANYSELISCYNDGFGFGKADFFSLGPGEVRSSKAGGPGRQ